MTQRHTQETSHTTHLHQEVVVLLLDVGREDGVHACQLACTLKHVSHAEHGDGTCACVCVLRMRHMIQ